MSLPDPVGPISLFESRLRTALADTAEAQTFLEADSADAAREKIMFSTHRDLGAMADGSYSISQLLELRPFIYLFAASGCALEAVASGPAGFSFSGECVVVFERNYPDDYKDEPESGEVDMRNKIGDLVLAVLKKCQNENTAGSYPSINLARFDALCVRTNEDSISDFGDAQSAQVTFVKTGSR